MWSTHSDTLCRVIALSDTTVSYRGMYSVLVLYLNGSIDSRHWAECGSVFYMNGLLDEGHVPGLSVISTNTD